MNSKVFQAFQAVQFPWKQHGSAHLFELLDLIFQTVDGVHQTPAGTGNNILITGCAGDQHSYHFNPHLKRHAKPFGHKIISSFAELLGLTIFHVPLTVVSPVLTMTFYQRTQTENHASFPPKTLSSARPCAAVGGFQHLTEYVLMGYMFYFFLQRLISCHGQSSQWFHDCNRCASLKRCCSPALTSPPPPFARCSWSPRWWSSPPLERAYARPSCWSLSKQGHRCQE